MIVDAQLHLWPEESPEHPWAPGGRERVHRPEPFTHEEAVALMDGAGVDRAVIVPPSWLGDSPHYALEAVARHPGRFAVMARIALDRREESAVLLPSWRDTPGMLGVRLTFMMKERAWLDDGTADWFWPAAESCGLPVMVHAPDGKEKILAVARRHPGLTLVIDHMGLSMDVAREGRLAEAIAGTVRFADCPNVCVKLSSAPNYSGEAYPFRDMAPHIKSVVEAFGPERCFWGTDVTRDWNKCSYAERVTHFTETLDFLDADALDWIMGRAVVERLGWTDAA